ncbi:MAG: hypothetical protein ACK53C_11280 [Pseudomonadota bacterium]
MQALLKSFVEDTLDGSRAGAASANRFLEEQVAAYEKRLAQSEAALAEFK